MYPNDQSQPPQSTPEPISAPSSAPEPVSQPQPPATSPKKSSGKIAVIVLIILSVLLTATVIFLAVRLANPAASSPESDGSDVSGNNSGSNSGSSDEPSGSGDDPVSSDIIHNASSPTGEQLLDIYLQQTGNDEFTTEFVDISAHASPIAPYEYVHATENTIENSDTGGAYFYRRNSDSDWVYSYSVGGHAAPMCEDILTMHERRAFYGFGCTVVDYSINPSGETSAKTITDKHPYYK